MKNIFKKIVVFLLTLEARAFLARFKPVVIAVTGTVGKTSTKDAIAAALAPFVMVRKSEKSYNSDIGVPLAILGEKNQWNNPFGWTFVFLKGIFNLLFLNSPNFLVLEVGTDRPGDIRAIVKWLKPHIVVVTKLSRAPVHVGNFSSIGELIAEKGALVSSLRSGGTLVVNADDTDVLAFRALAQAGTKVVSFGFSEDADVRAGEFASLVEINGTLGTPPLYAALAALAVAKTFGFDLARAAKALSARALAPGRMRILSGINGARIIDDTYNSSPVAVAEALKTLEEIQIQEVHSTNARGKKIAVLGDMLELGDLSNGEHKKMVEEAVRIADVVWLIGERAAGTGIVSQKIRVFSDARSAGEVLHAELRAGDIVLIKGSQGMRMERTVERALAEPARASELLVRQEKEWKRKS
ncbi:MAG: Mur ligase family protein [bacterium]|nr:Mur ligase family protein [bacterium]